MLTAQYIVASTVPRSIDFDSQSTEVDKGRVRLRYIIRWQVMGIYLKQFSLTNYQLLLLAPSLVLLSISYYYLHIVQSYQLSVTITTQLEVNPYCLQAPTTVNCGSISHYEMRFPTSTSPIITTTSTVTTVYTDGNELVTFWVRAVNNAGLTSEPEIKTITTDIIGEAERLQLGLYRMYVIRYMQSMCRVCNMICVDYVCVCARVCVFISS